MGLLQAAYRTYENQAHLAGVTEEGKEPLTPVSHLVQNAHIEVSITDDGVFQSARAVPKGEDKTIIPVTMESASRTGNNRKAHPLCDQLRYLAPWGAEKYQAYLTQLEQWAKSEFSHPKVRAVLRYIRSGTIVNDLAAAGVITLDAQGNPGGGRIEGIEYDKCMVRWRIDPAPETSHPACWMDVTLFESFTAFYTGLCAQAERDLCLISGREDVLCETHPKGILAANFGAKLISANDASGFTYRGRFTRAREAGSVGYTASQKAHSALRWVASNQGVTLGGRTFLCWNPEGRPVPTFAFLGMRTAEPPTKDFVAYRKQLLGTLGGYRQALHPTDDVVVAVLDAATTGRLSVTYYHELKASDFLSRLEDWYATCCWNSRVYGMQSPALKRIAVCAFGTQRGNFIEADDHVLREHVQRLLHCIVDRQSVPADIVRALTVKAGTPLAYTPENRETLLATACAVVRKYRNDRLKKEEWTLALDTNSLDRSYLFGRLLAVAEQAERSTYEQEEKREPNAIRMQSVFSQRPLYAWRILEEALNPYFAHLSPGLRAYFKNIIGEITDKLPPADDPELGKKLADTYLLGYYHQRTALTQKKQTSVTEGNKHESAEEQN